MAQYNHTQVTPTVTWSVYHQLNKPSVICDVFVNTTNGLVKILPNNVVHTDNNTLTIYFTTAYSGAARVVG